MCLENDNDLQFVILTQFAYERGNIYYHLIKNSPFQQNYFLKINSDLQIQ